MSTPKKTFDAYRRAEILTADRETILLMLYAHSLRSLKMAIAAVEAGDLPSRATHITKVQDIVSELRSSLSHEQSPRIAEALEKLYAYVTRCLLEASSLEGADAVRSLKDALGVMTTLNSAWEEAVEQVRAAQS